MRVGVLMVLAGMVALAGCGGGDSSDPTPTAGSVEAQVVRVVDGDTIVASVEGADQYVRYIGIDTPETVKPGTPVQCFGERASAENHRLVDGHTVRLVFDQERRDVYGRLLAYVFAGSRFVNATLVRDGYARTLTIAPNTAHASLFDRLAGRAGQAGRGLWGRC
ncbi:MAG: thermonuclease family protein [Solirubrobacterales bacterium]